ncbi:hypothetical protein ACH5RR_041293 [Cinchona calisaya]|uniref:CXXC motif containing zinc binding protein n=1 Tax=Cinchona calisaya TaxID=153742 RepID=A0ABD2XTC2_9GENT
MVNYMLMITAKLENLTDLQPQGGCDDPNLNYFFKLKCERCGEMTPKEACLNLNDMVFRGKGSTNLVKKCKFCLREGTVTMITGRGRPLTQIQSQFGHFTPLMVFDCKGFEPLDFSFSSDWEADSIEGTRFDGINLSRGEFVDYDEKGDCPVMISNLRAIFRVVK